MWDHRAPMQSPLPWQGGERVRVPLNEADDERINHTGAKPSGLDFTMTAEQDRFSLFRSFGTEGLVIFERDRTLLKRENWPDGLSLGDIDLALVHLVRRLRLRHVRFGFVSDQKGLNADAAGKHDAAALIRSLDQILRCDDAMPDFWMAWTNARVYNVSAQAELTGSREHAAMISHAMTRYSVSRSSCIVVGRSQKILSAAARVGVRVFDYANHTEKTAIKPTQFCGKYERPDLIELEATLTQFARSSNRSCA